VKGYTEKQAEATRELIKYIQKYCPNAKTIIRHWDVNGKQCPLPMVGKENKMWKEFKKKITK
jgi:N-acetylmuramoyl-L-alanine amidase CwlA